MNKEQIEQVGIVIIGRNEGKRLPLCFESLRDINCVKVYVDSGSIDNSVEIAKLNSVAVVKLDLSKPFSASRARNEGFSCLVNINSNIKFVQFIDGDCEMREGWISTGYEFLSSQFCYAVVSGRLRERNPGESIYNLLCDIEWNTAIGDSASCGGIAMIRVEAFNAVNGYREGLLAGEEPEMCFRLRENGWKIHKLIVEMALHDAAMTKFTQWWGRAKRSGYAYANGCYLHGDSVERFNVKQTISVVAWALFLPLLIVLLAVYDVRFFGLIGLYPLQVMRLSIKGKPALNTWWKSISYASSNVIGKFPQAMGMLSFVFNQMFNQRAKLIEYK